MKYFFYITSVFILVWMSSCVPISSTVTHTTITSPNSGAISLQLNGNPTSTYLWSNGATTQNISGLQASYTPYSIVVTGVYGSQSFVYPITPQYVLCDVSWTSINSNTANVNLAGSPYPHGAIGKTASGATVGYNASAYSINVLPASNNGLVRFQIGSYGDFFIGLSPQYISDLPASINYGLYFRTRTIQSYIDPLGVYHPQKFIHEVYAQNNVTHTTVYIGNYISGDVFDIQKANGTILFRQNGQVTAGSFAINTSTNLIVDLAVKDPGMSLTYVRTSFTDAIDYKNYAALKKELDATYAVMYNNITVKYNEKYYNPALQYRIYDWKRNPIIASTISNVSNGVNFLTINPSATLQDSQVYVLEVTNSKGEVYKLKFQYKKSQ